MKKILFFICIVFSINSFGHNYYERKVKDEYLSNICITFEHYVAGEWYNQLSEAIQNYNDEFKESTKLGFCSYPYSSDPFSTPTATIYISLVDNKSYPWDGWGEHPSRWTGKPGKEILINLAHIYKLDYNERVALLMHEIGHNIGLNHTDSGNGYIIPGTNSLMKSLFREQTGDNSYKYPNFSHYDIKAIEYLYK